MSTVFRNCQFTENQALDSYYGGGAGMCWRWGKPKFDSCLFDGNNGRHGGSVYLYGSNSCFSRCTFSKSTSTENGGVAYIFNSNIPTFVDCNIVESTCNNSGGAFFITGTSKPIFSNVHIYNCQASIYGGAIAISGAAKPKFTNVDIYNCNAVCGGGVYAGGSTLSIFQQCVFLNNQADGPIISPDGGGAWFTENAHSAFIRCRFRENFARDDGGGISVAGPAKIDLWNTLSVYNIANNTGSGLHFTSTSIGYAMGSITNCTIFRNVAMGDRGGGGICLEAANTLNVDSSIICQNSPDGIPCDVNNPNLSINYSCLQEFCSDSGNLYCDECCLLDPNTFELLDGSQCIDAGNPDPNMNDGCQPPGKGEPRNDMGSTGGPENCDYLPSEPNLMGWWTFDRIFGIWAPESSGRSSDAKLVNGPISVPGRLGRALDFDGIDDYVSVTIDVSENNYAVSLWFKTTSENDGIFSVVAGSGHDRHIYLSSGNLKIRVYNNEVIFTTGHNYADGNWHCIVHTFGGEQGGQKLYVDGELKASGSKSSSDFDWQTEIRIGYSVDAGQRYFRGKIDDVRIYDRSLSPMDVQQLYR